MLNIINNLAPFFEDCYRKISVREYSILIKVSPPTASKILKDFNKQGLLKNEEDRRYIFFYANIENKDFIDLSRIYWRKKLNDLILYLNKDLVDFSVVLFGSLSKAEANIDSDVDLAVFSSDKKNIDFRPYEKKLKRKISIYWFKSVESENSEKTLINNIINGYILFGKMRFK